MAQIKKIVKPGDLIRGAKVGPAALDKDGNVITLKDLAANAGKVLTVGEDGSVSFQDVPSEFPEGAQSGDVLAWGGETGPEWRPHYPESGSEGDVLTLGETGPEWAPPSGSGGSEMYQHNILLEIDGSSECAVFSIISTDSNALTFANLAQFLYNNGIDGTALNKKLWCFVYFSGAAYSRDFGSVYSSNGTSITVQIKQSGSSADVSTGNVSDTVFAI